MLRSLPELLAQLGELSADEQLVVMRLHQSVQSLVVVTPGHAALVERTLGLLCEAARPPRRHGRVAAGGPRP